MRRPVRRLVIVLWLTALWVLLWRDLSVANVASGVLVAVLVEVVLSLRWAGWVDQGHRVRPLALGSFVAYFAWKLLEANLVLARTVVTPRRRVRTGIIAVPMAGSSDLVVTVVANAVSLTPGTLTVEARRGDRAELYVHVLFLHDIERARADVRTLTRLASAAFWREPAPTAIPGEPAR